MIGGQMSSGESKGGVYLAGKISMGWGLGGLVGQVGFE